jgi:2-polyprenyl-3-methyl-5-hydroxy-6-metoxy-1,4-benzoquinol methylase
MLAIVPCAVCGSFSFKPLYSATVDQTDDSNPSKYFGSSRLKAGHLPIVRCSGCGLVMTNPQDDTATLARIYSAHEDKAYDLEYDSRRRGALEHFKLVTAYQVEPARILDVGCATGIFVCVAQDSGWQATGIDASEWMVARGSSRCPAAEFRVGALEDVTFPLKSFAVITLWDVLEHVSSPIQTLQRLRRWLSPDGWLFLSVPNADSIVARLMGRRWVLLLREHLWYFSPRTIETLLSESGFTLVHTRSKLVEFSLANVLGRLAQYPSILRGTASSVSGIPAMGRVKLRFPIGEMDVVAKVK